MPDDDNISSGSDDCSMLIFAEVQGCNKGRTLGWARPRVWPRVGLP